MSNKIVYSTNGEDFNFDEIGDIAACAPVGEVVTILQGQAHTPSISNLVCPLHVCDQASAIMFERHGEIIEDGEWLEYTTKEQDEELGKELSRVFEKWLIKHNLQPNFFTVKNVKELRIMILDENGGFQIISEGKEQ